MTTMTPGVPNPDARGESARLAARLLASASGTSSKRPQGLLVRLAHGEPLSDIELATVQDWALDEFSAGLSPAWEPDQRAKEADRLVGLMEQLKSTWT